MANILQKTAFSLVKSRLALGSPGWLFVCHHHAENGQVHRKRAVDCTLMITSKGETLFQTRSDIEGGIIGQASLLHS